MFSLTPEVTFVLLVLALLGWMAIPLVPAFREFLSPRDAAPLEAVGSDAGHLTFFADSFRERMTREGLLGDVLPPRLSDGTPVRVHDQHRPLPARKAPYFEVVVLLDGTPVPAGIALGAEAVARQTLHGGPGVTYRAVLGEADIILGPSSSIVRWVHAQRRLIAGDETRLSGRATAGAEIVLGRQVRFDRLEASVVRVAVGDPKGVAPSPPVPLAVPESAVAFTLPPDATVFAPGYWRTEESLRLTANTVLIGTAISAGSIEIGAGARVTGSLKARGDLIVRATAVVEGSLAAWGRITIEAGAIVGGPVISESSVEVDAAKVGSETRPATVTAPRIRLGAGATVYGAVMAGEDGVTT